MKTTPYALVAGTFTAIPATCFTRRVELQEDGTGSGVGLLLKFPADNFTLTYLFPPDQQPKVLEDKVAQGHGGGENQGWPAQTGLPPIPATIYVMASAPGATVLRVTEYD